MLAIDPVQNASASRVRVDCLPISARLPSSHSEDRDTADQQKPEGDNGTCLCLFLSPSSHTDDAADAVNRAGHRGCPHGHGGAAEARPKSDALETASTSTRRGDGFAQAPAGGGCVFAGRRSGEKPSITLSASCANGVQDMENSKLHALLDHTVWRPMQPCSAIRTLNILTTTQSNTAPPA